jgi:hypothetical protein
MDDLDHIEFEHAANSHDEDYLSRLEEDAGVGEGGSRFFGPTSTNCRYCGEPTLYWFQNEKGAWRLEDKDGKLHICKKEILTKRQKTSTNIELATEIK